MDLGFNESRGLQRFGIKWVGGGTRRPLCTVGHPSRGLAWAMMDLCFSSILCLASGVSAQMFPSKDDREVLDRQKFGAAGRERLHGTTWVIESRLSLSDQ